jgi:hypothetical protein
VPAHDEVRHVLQSASLLERLAAIEHERWAHWQRYLHDQCAQADDGTLVIPKELVERWEAQISTPYAELTPEERESDRDQVRRYLPVIVETLKAARDQGDSVSMPQSPQE